MFDFSWSELGLIAIVALIVIGPKDLPRVMRMVGQWVGRARAIAREFQGSIDQMMREAELDDIKRNLDRATNFDLDREIRQSIDPQGDIHRSLTDPVLRDPLAEPPKPVAPPTESATPATEPPSATLPEPRIELPPLAEPSEPAAAAPAASAAPEPEAHRN